MVGESPEQMEGAGGYTYQTVWEWRKAWPRRAETSARRMSITEMKNRSQHGSEDRIMLYLPPRTLFPSLDSYTFWSTFPLGYSKYVSGKQRSWQSWPCRCRSELVPVDCTKQAFSKRCRCGGISLITTIVKLIRTTYKHQKTPPGQNSVPEACLVSMLLLRGCWDHRDH